MCINRNLRDVYYTSILQERNLLCLIKMVIAVLVKRIKINIWNIVGIFMKVRISFHQVFILTITALCGATIIGSQTANAAFVEPNAELELIGIFDGNNHNPTGLSAISNEVGLPEGDNLRDYIIGETGSKGGTDNGFMIDPDTYKDGNEAIAGEWWFDPTESSFDSIDYIIIKASNHYALYKVNYLETLLIGDTIHGLWAVSDLGKHAMSHMTAYSLPGVPLPATGLLLGSALLGLLGFQHKRR